ncbi:MAG TPA: hypothetical protein VMT53_18545 [Terriglobales bacterium]|nr:hypothetical protein [Terriglobales bacterium]
MSVTTLPSPGRHEVSTEINRIVSSETLRASESLCRLLRYLAQRALEHPGASLKEYQIATEVFGRPADFDPHLDSTIRVQAGRLRLKLAEYYATEGRDDDIVVELPKGTYVLNFRANSPAAPRDTIPQSDKVRADPKPVVLPIAMPPNRRSRIVIPLLATLLVAAATVIAFLVVDRTFSSSAVIPASNLTAPLQTFWRAFAQAPEEPWVVFSNGAFIGRPETGMRYFNAATDNRDKILDHYTGVGEVLAIHELDRVFYTMHREIRVKRGSLLSLDDAKNDNLIFVGSSAENLSLLELPGSREFIFKRMDSGPRRGDLGVFNVHPKPGEPTMFLATPGPPLTEDYATLTLTSGLTPGRHMLILAGTTTLGTQAAAEFVCRADSLQELMERLGVDANSEVKPFEAVLRVKVTRGVPVESHLVTLRKTGS